MVPWTGFASALLLASLLTVLALRFEHTPDEKRTHLFETDRGARTNPFADLSAGASKASVACSNCGEELESVSHRFCSSCVGSD